MRGTCATKYKHLKCQSRMDKLSATSGQVSHSNHNDIYSEHLSTALNTKLKGVILNAKLKKWP